MNKILIIDDDRELCALIKRSVQAEHIEADFCNTGKEGLQKLKGRVKKRKFFHASFAYEYNSSYSS